MIDDMIREGARTRVIYMETATGCGCLHVYNPRPARMQEQNNEDT